MRTETGEVPLEQIVQDLVRELDGKRAEDIKLLRVQEILQICSYFVLATGTSARHLQTLADTVQRHMKPLSVPRLGVEGYKDGRWICLDYSELVVHLFDRESRLFYDLDHLWDDAPSLL